MNHPHLATKSAAVALVAFLLSTGCAPSDESDEVNDVASAAIVGGDIDTEHIAVVMLRDQRAPNYACSGTLIAPGLVLTAAHCVAPSLSSNCTAGYTNNPGGIDHLADNMRVRVTTSRATSVARGVTWLFPQRDGHCGDDIALLILDSDLAGIKPLAVELAAKPTKGQPLSAVGFGLDEQGVFGTRRVLDGLVVRRVGTEAGKLSEAPHVPTLGEFSVPPGQCKGDSGGPAISASKRVIGVLSRQIGGEGKLVECAKHDNIVVSTTAHAAFIRRGMQIAASQP